MKDRVGFNAYHIDIGQGVFFCFTLPDKGLDHIHITVEYRDDIAVTGTVRAMVWAQREDVPFLRGLVEVVTLSAPKGSDAIVQIIRRLNNNEFLHKLFEFSKAFAQYAEDQCEEE